MHYAGLFAVGCGEDRTEIEISIMSGGKVFQMLLWSVLAGGSSAVQELSHLRILQSPGSVDGALNCPHHPLELVSLAFMDLADMNSEQAYFFAFSRLDNFSFFKNAIRPLDPIFSVEWRVTDLRRTALYLPTIRTEVAPFCSETVCSLTQMLINIESSELPEGAEMNTLEIRKMSRIEHLQAMEALWDSLLDEEAEIESPEWHRDILNQRKRKIETGEAEFISLEKLRASRKHESQRCRRNERGC
ncbi:MAG: addiction module protein [Syntrophobacteraceae bacterium]